MYLSVLEKALSLMRRKHTLAKLNIFSANAHVVSIFVQLAHLATLWRACKDLPSCTIYVTPLSQDPISHSIVSDTTYYVTILYVMYLIIFTIVQGAEYVRCEFTHGSTWQCK
jgi:hypothetical protein